MCGSTDRRIYSAGSTVLPEPTEIIVETSSDLERSSSRKKDKRRSKRSEGDETVDSKLNDASIDVDASSSKELKAQKKAKKSKKSDKKDDAMDLDVPDVDSQVPAENEAESVDVKKPKDKKTKKKDKIKSKPEDASEEPPSIADESIPRAVPQTDGDASPAPSPKKKREKRPKDRVKNIPVEDPSPSETITNKKKKARKNRTPYPDPELDETLNSQAQKALDYAFTQFNAPKEWKFNKARQNWIVRNVFNVESVTILSLPLDTRLTEPSARYPKHISLLLSNTSLVYRVARERYIHLDIIVEPLLKRITEAQAGLQLNHRRPSPSRL
jgi:WKF domain